MKRDNFCNIIEASSMTTMQTTEQRKFKLNVQFRKLSARETVKDDGILIPTEIPSLQTMNYHAIKMKAFPQSKINCLKKWDSGLHFVRPKEKRNKSRQYYTLQISSSVQLAIGLAKNKPKPFIKKERYWFLYCVIALLHH